MRRILYLKKHGATADQPLATYYQDGHRRNITPTDITDVLRQTTMLLGPKHGFVPKDISARSLRAAGAMALLCAQVDTDIIRLLGRWRSDEMLRYLHVQAEPVMRHFARKMVHHGSFQLLPNREVPLY